MISGGPVDIITGAPAGPGHGSAARRRAAEADLVEKMSAAGLAETAAHQVVVEEVETVLSGIIAGVLDKDPQARTCIEILRKLGGRVTTAREAARQYIRIKAAGGAPARDVRGETTTQQAGPR